MTALVLLPVLALPPGLEQVARGGISFYWPGDSCQTGRVLACDTPCRRRLYRDRSIHVAMRGVRRRFPCGTAVVVCSEQTGRCVTAPVLDAGPWGIIDGAGKRMKWRKLEPPTGWRFRGIVDVSREVWKRLGRPSFLSRVRIYR
jgi:hypothetical protein